MEHIIILNDTIHTDEGFFNLPIDITKQVSIGASVHQRFAEELDLGLITITHSLREKEYDMFSLIQIMIYQKGKEIKRHELFIENDEVTPINKKGIRYYKHEIRLIELTHILDQELINTLNFTQPILGRYLAPFEQDFDINISGYWETLDPYRSDNPDTINIISRYTAVLDKPEIYSRYDGKVNIPKINQMIFQFSSATSDYFFQNFEPVLLEVYKIVEDAFGEYDEQLLPEYLHILSDEDFEADLPVGRYRIRIGNATQVNAKVQDSDPDTWYPIRRFLSFYIGVDKPRYTMFDVINRIRNTSPIEKLSILPNTRKFKINEDLKNRLEKITAPQMLLKELTTREGINEALKYVNSVCRLIRRDDVFEIVENHFNTRNEPYDIGDIFSFSSEKNTLEYSTSLRSYLKRTISNNSKDTPSIKTPSAKDYEGYRSETLQILPSTAKILLSEPIYRLVKVSARLSYQFPVNGNITTNVNSRVVNDLEVDLTPRVIEEKEFKLRRAQVFVKGEDVLKKAGSPRGNFLRSTQGEFARYKYMGKEIDFTEPFENLEGFFAKPYLEYVLHSALYEKLVFDLGRNISVFNGMLRLPGDPDRAFWNLYNGLPYTAGQSTLLPQTPVDTGKITNVELRIEYITMSETIHSSQRENTEDIYLETKKKINQNSRITNYEQASKQSYGLSQRYGVPTISFSKLTKYPKSLPEPGDYNENNELIVEKETIFHKNHVVGKFEASRDFNRFSKYIGIDREYRYSEIPDPTVSENRVEIYEEFLEYYTGDVPSVLQNDTYITNLFTETMLNTLTQEENKNDIGISNVLIRTDGTKELYPDKPNSKKYVTVPTISMGGKNVLSFGFHFQDTRIVGDIVDFNGLFTILDEPFGMWQEYVEYTKLDGTFNTFEFNLVNAIPNKQESVAYYRTRRLPLVDYNPSTALYQIEDISFTSTDNEGFENPLMVYKDQGERFGLVYQVSLVPRDKEAREEIIFGTNFTSFNYLVNGKQENKFLYAYTNDTKYFKFDDQKIKSGYSSKLELNASIVYKDNFAIGILVSLPQNTTSWAIGNDNGDLDIANNTNNNQIFLIPRNKRKDVKYNLFEHEPIELEGVSELTSVIFNAEIVASKQELTSGSSQETSVSFNAEIVAFKPEVFESGDILSSFSVTTNAIGDKPATFESGDILANFDMTANAIGDKPIVFESGNILSSFTLETTSSGELQYDVGWVEGGTSPSGGTTCTSINHVGYVKCDVVGYDKEWQPTGNSGAGEPSEYVTSLPNPDNYQENDTIVLYSSMLDAWQEYEIVLVPVYGNCETCSII